MGDTKGVIAAYKWPTFGLELNRHPGSYVQWIVLNSALQLIQTNSL